jgi:uncharacterized protein with HEPN domain
VLRDPRLYLEDIISACNSIDEYTAGMSFDAFVADRRTVDAVLWCITIIGEASRNIPDGIRDEIPDVEWREATDMRNAVVHGYHTIDLDLVWQVIKTETKPLRDAIATFLAR